MLNGRQPGWREVDTLVVGAGPAGLFASLSLAAAGVEDILLIDAGPDATDRSRPPAGQAGSPSADYERGVGGAGLFSDGKLCLSLDVGGHLETSLGSAERQRLLQQIEQTFLNLVDGGFAYRRPNGSARLAAAAAEEVGLGFKYYPVAHIGTDRCHDVIVRLRDVLAGAGVAIEAESELVDLDADQTGVTASVRSPRGVERIRTAHVVLAMGKVGAPQQAGLASSLGVELSSQPIYTGVRFEAPSAAVAPLFSLTKDPKYNLRFNDGTKIKTHCASEGGEVIALHYDSLPLAGGHNYSGAATDRSGFSILWDGLDPGPDSYETALNVMRAVSEETDGRLLVQRLQDFLIRQPSSPSDIEAIALTCADAVPGDLSAFLPPEYLARATTFLDHLSLLAPEILHDEAVVYGPAIEWWMKRIAVASSYMETSAPGVFVCGDGSGWSQGIVHAAATGLLAAEGIHHRKVNVGEWIARRTGEQILAAA
jgi:uncharacterized protein